MKYFFYLAFNMLFLNIVSAQEKPNILWITIEDTSPQFIGCYGNDNSSTPVIDKLAREGVRFTNAFSTGTVCSPSRSAIITGVPTNKMGTGNHRSNYPIPNFIKGFPTYLKAQGYYTSNNVKTDYNIANEKDFINEAWHESSNTANWNGRAKNQPFFSVFNFPESHQSRTMSMSYDWYIKHVWNHLSEQDRIKDTDFEMPPIYKDTPEMRKQFARVYNSIKLTDNRIGKLLEKLEEDNLKDDTIIFFFADHGEGMPRGKTNGINYGYRVPFVVWFPEKYKHLSPWGTSGVVSDELINFEDLAPTIISMVGGEIPKYLKGRVLIGENRTQERPYLLLSADRADNGPDLVRTITDGRYVYSRNYMSFMPQMRYIRYLEIADITRYMRLDYKNGNLNELQESLFKKRSSEILYDIENDLWETKKLVDNPKYKSVLKKMRSQLDKKLLEAHDVHFLPEYEIGLISKTGTAYEYRLDNDKYAIKQILKVALLSGKTSKTDIKKQIKFLKSDNKIVRYWAIMGLMVHDGSVLFSYQNELKAAMDDVYPPVAITAAALVYENFKTEESTEILLQYSKSDNMDLALMAINYLLYSEYKEPFIETIQEVHRMPNRNYNVKAACMDFLGILGMVQNNSSTKN